MWPDQEYLVRLVATLSMGSDEIFALEYVPKAEEKRRSVQAPLTVANNDGLLTVPLALLPKRPGKALNMLTLSK